MSPVGRVGATRGSSSSTRPRGTRRSSARGRSPPRSSSGRGTGSSRRAASRSSARAVRGSSGSTRTRQADRAARRGAIRGRSPIRADGSGFRIRRRNHYLGRVIAHGAWSSDVVLRLFRKDAGALRRSARARVGPRSTVPSAISQGRLEHRSYRNLAHHWEKMGVWADLWAEQALRDGRRATRWDLLLRPPARFVKGYLLKAGFLDGAPGLVLAFMDAVYVGTKYARLLERQARSQRGGTMSEETTPAEGRRRSSRRTDPRRRPSSPDEPEPEGSPRSGSRTSAAWTCAWPAF